MCAGQGWDGRGPITWAGQGAAERAFAHPPRVACKAAPCSADPRNGTCGFGGGSRAVPKIKKHTEGCNPTGARRTNCWGPSGRQPGAFTGSCKLSGPALAARTWGSSRWGSIDVAPAAPLPFSSPRCNLNTRLWRADSLPFRDIPLIPATAWAADK